MVWCRARMGADSENGSLLKPNFEEVARTDILGMGCGAPDCPFCKDLLLAKDVCVENKAHPIKIAAGLFVRKCSVLVEEAVHLEGWMSFLLMVFRPLSAESGHFSGASNRDGRVRSGEARLLCQVLRTVQQLSTWRARQMLLKEGTY